MSAPPAIPDHTLRRPIGRGAYGEVWLAKNVMGAPRAVKIVWRRQFDTNRPYEREFAGIQRYEPVSRCADGLVHVLHVGRNDAEGYFYYVMELADPTVPMACQSQEPDPVHTPDPHDLPPLVDYIPRTLRSDLKQLSVLPVSDCVRVALDVVGGLAKLHERGLVHRDVKPGNIIFVEGRAKLADIGLVSRESEGRTFVGTEGYIPPEGPGSPCADIYALGMVLYEAITGYPPDRFPKVPSAWFAAEAGTEALEFHAVVLKACEGDKARRYQSAEEMQADLALLQSGQSVRRLRALEERVRRWRRIGWAAALSVAVAVTTALAANWRARVAAEGRAKEAQLREQAQKSLARAESAERESRQQLYTSLLEQARATVLSGELGQRTRALDAVRRAAAISNSVELRREAFAALTLPDLRFERDFPFGPDFTVRELDPRFERIALCRGRGPVEIHDTSEDRLVATFPASTNLMAYIAQWSDDGQFLSVKRDYDQRGRGGDLEVWQVASARRVLLIRNARWNACSFHPHAPQLLTGGPDGLIVVWDLQGGKELARAKFDGTPERLVYSPDGKRVATYYQENDGWGVSVHQAADSKLLASHVFGSTISSIAWDPSGCWIATSDTGGAIHRMDAQTGEVRFLGQHKVEAVTTAFTPDGAYLITGGWERELICWDVERMKRAFTIGLDSYQVQFRSDGRECAVKTTSSVQLYAFEQPAAHREFTEDLGPRLRRVAFSPDGRWLAASADKRLGIWDLARGGPGALAEEGFNAFCYFSPDGRELFGSRGNDPGKNCFRWRYSSATNTGTRPVLERLPFQRPKGFSSLSLRSNSVVVTAAGGSQILLPQAVQTEPDRWVETAKGFNGVSPDGRWLGIYRSYSKSLYVYGLPGLENVAKLTHLANIGDFQFSPLGDEVAISSRWGVEFWSTLTWERTRVLTNFDRILYAPDARTVWLTKDFRTAGLYDTRTLQPLLTLPSGMLPLALSRDGRQVAVSLDMRRLQVWDLTVLREELAKLELGW